MFFGGVFDLFSAQVVVLITHGFLLLAKTYSVAWCLFIQNHPVFSNLIRNAGVSATSTVGNNVKNGTKMLINIKLKYNLLTFFIFKFSIFRRSFSFEMSLKSNS